MPQDECVCQSCGMPIDKHEDFGTNSDLTKNEDFCIFCFQNGLFSESDISKDEMVGRITKNMVDRTNLPEEQAKMIADQIISSLKRWQ